MSLPELNIGRWFHSSCTLGNTLYILGGEANDGEMVNSIEKLTKIDSHSDLSNLPQWLLIQLD